MPNTWMVRAGRGGTLFSRFRQEKRVAIGWHELGPLDGLDTREAVAEKVRAVWAESNQYEVGMNAGQVYRFRCEMDVGDRMVTYDPDARTYLVGRITGGYVYDPTFDERHPNCRAVEWDGEVPRDALSMDAKNSLGSASTLFQIAPAVSEQVLFDDLEVKAVEFIKDRLTRLSARDMEHFVAGLLRGMGYKSRVTPVGPDRGLDVLASPDGLGLQDPRIFVEVRHRNGRMGAPEIRRFLGGRRPGDRCLFVSTGGFAREAHYEAERAAVPITLVDLDMMVELTLEHYDRLTVDTQRLLPLKRLWWPA